ncbi:MAG: CRISPR-associated endonuclease Cas2 [Bacteroidetes bacterium]|nr:CRISPR-associated endonuclease Cas2 [Bacteroidota bacterium]
MIYRIVSYDIKNDRLRTKVAKKLLSWGLVRLQFSVFCGLHSVHKWEQLQQELSVLFTRLGPPEAEDKIFFIVVSRRTLAEMHWVGEASEIQSVINEPITLFVGNTETENDEPMY